MYTLSLPLLLCVWHIIPHAALSYLIARRERESAYIHGVVRKNENHCSQSRNTGGDVLNRVFLENSWQDDQSSRGVLVVKRSE